MARTRDAGIPEEQARQRYRELPAPPVLQAMWQTNLTLVYGRPNKTPTEVGAELEAHCLAALKK